MVWEKINQVYVTKKIRISLKTFQFKIIDLTALDKFCNAYSLAGFRLEQVHLPHVTQLIYTIKDP